MSYFVLKHDFFCVPRPRDCLIGLPVTRSFLFLNTIFDIYTYVGHGIVSSGCRFFRFSRKIVFWVRYANHCYIKPPPSGGKNNGWYTSTVLLVACSSRAKTCRHGGAPRPRKFSEQLEYHFYLSEVSIRCIRGPRVV